MDQTILAVDDSGKFLEYIKKEIGHTGEGRRHLAITVLLFNSKGEVLLQKRKHKVFDNIWDFTASTHPLHTPHSCHSERSEESLANARTSNKLRPAHHQLSLQATAGGDPSLASSSTSRSGLIAQDDKKCKNCSKDKVDETLEQATERALKIEYDIDNISNLENLGFFNYFSPYHTVQGDFCENEHCAMMVGEYNGEVKLHPSVGYEYKWVNKKEFLKDVENNPKNYAPWVVEGMKLLKQVDF